jgi:hypothetical protein
MKKDLVVEDTFARDDKRYVGYRTSQAAVDNSCS